MDTIFVERIWLTVKYEPIFLHDFQTIPEVQQGLHDYFQFSNHQRLHQALDYKTPA